MTTRQELLIGIAASIVFVACVYLLRVETPAPAPATSPAAERGIPPLTPEIQAVLAKSHGFQALVSYTDRGFEPNTVTIKKGDTIRFTNNSREDLWVAATGGAGALYPNITNGCGSSALDTCRVLKPLEFWEFTFDTAGTWSYQNNRDTTVTGHVRVQ